MLRQILHRIKNRLFPSPKIVQVPVYVPIFQNELLKGRTALITGGTSGIGLAIAKAFLNSGARVIITGRSQEKIRRAIAELDSSNANGMELNNLDVASFDKKLKDSFSKFGEIDILVNNAGVIKCNTFGDIEQENYDEIMNANLRGSVFLSQTIANIWKREQIQGNILNICSSSSMRPGNSPYVLSKWGMRSLTLGMAKELIQYGIVVNGLAPGPTATRMFVGNGEDGINWPKNPSGRLATEEEIANLAIVMVSALARMVVGDVLYATGGSAVITVDDL